MIPVDQTIFGPKGNCFAACLASILECGIDEIPEVAAYDDADEAISVINKWLLPKGLVYLEMCVPQKECKLFFSDKDFYHVIIGPTNMSKELYHAIVGRQGKAVFDPLPNSTGILSEKLLRIGVFVKSCI